MAAVRPKSVFQNIADAIGPNVHVPVFDHDGELNPIGFCQFMARYERDPSRFDQPSQKKQRLQKVSQDPRESVWWKLYVLDPHGLYRLSHGREGSEPSSFLRFFPHLTFGFKSIRHINEKFFQLFIPFYFQRNSFAAVSACLGESSTTW
jgi:hypothetical protein